MQCTYALPQDLPTYTSTLKVGLFYENGTVVEEDSMKAAEYYSRSANLSYAGAQHNLAIFYSKGRGVEKDEEKAYQLYSRAAAMGHSGSQNNLGRIATLNLSRSTLNFPPPPN